MGKKKPEGKVKAAGILIMTRGEEPEILLMKHHDRWDLPKGHCELNERYLETALRETEEETGIQPDQIEIDTEFRFKIEYPVKYKRWGNEVFTKKVKYFLGFIEKRAPLKLTEHAGAEWIKWSPPHEIQKQTIDPLLQAVADHLREIESSES